MRLTTYTILDAPRSSPSCGRVHLGGSTIAGEWLQPSGMIRRGCRESGTRPAAGRPPLCLGGVHLAVRAAGVPSLSAKWVSVDSTTSMENPLIALKLMPATVWPTVITSIVAFAPE